MTAEPAINLYRPVGAEELALIAARSCRAFPPRLPDLPIFYRVTTEAYAVKIARDWNTKPGSKQGYVTRFKVARSFMDRYEPRLAGGKTREADLIAAERETGSCS